eukprot:TRINITY_DN4396_c0_g1_i1.p1 TRINITY_DN4396_c0_g1~~TRINITY_DN4396_c0_g1_i1.p1  ORF type:complete len:614 (-),score=73.33 TRINITY_DN4396_c0_g1_i1:83-1795(-)
MMAAPPSPGHPAGRPPPPPDFDLRQRGVTSPPNLQPSAPPSMRPPSRPVSPPPIHAPDHLAPAYDSRARRVSAPADLQPPMVLTLDMQQPNSGRSRAGSHSSPPSREPSPAPYPGRPASPQPPQLRAPSPSPGRTPSPRHSTEMMLPQQAVPPHLVPRPRSPPVPAEAMVYYMPAQHTPVPHQQPAHHHAPQPHAADPHAQHHHQQHHKHYSHWVPPPIFGHKWQVYGPFWSQLRAFVKDEHQLLGLLYVKKADPYNRVRRFYLFLTVLFMSFATSMLVSRTSELVRSECDTLLSCQNSCVKTHNVTVCEPLPLLSGWTVPPLKGRRISDSEMQVFLWPDSGEHPAVSDAAIDEERRKDSCLHTRRVYSGHGTRPCLRSCYDETLEPTKMPGDTRLPCAASYANDNSLVCVAPKAFFHCTPNGVRNTDKYLLICITVVITMAISLFLKALLKKTAGPSARGCHDRCHQCCTRCITYPFMLAVYVGLTILAIFMWVNYSNRPTVQNWLISYVAKQILDIPKYMFFFVWKGYGFPGLGDFTDTIIAQVWHIRSVARKNASNVSLYRFRSTYR